MVSDTKGGMFRYADGVDKLLLLLGTLGCIGDGMMSSLTMYILSGASNEYATTAGVSLTIEVVNKYTLQLFYIAIVCGISAFVEGICWTRTAERQTSRMRIEYLKSVLRQEVGFFDSQDASSSTFQVVSIISSDAHSIQDVIAEKIPNALSGIWGFISSILVAALLSWRMAIASFPFAIMFIIPALGFGKVMMGIGLQMKDAYGIAGGIAEQAISAVRTVYSYVGERQTYEKFSDALQKSTDLGIKLGFTKGLLLGSMGMIFVVWAFIAWAGSTLVIQRNENASDVFMSGVCIVMAGLAVMSALPNLGYITEATAAAKRIAEMIDRNPLIDSTDVSGKIPSTLRGEVEFKNISFTYPSRPDTPILQNLNLKVKAGKTVGLVGGSGSGKSTIISLLERFYDPVGGDIFIDGYNIKRVPVRWLRSQMGLVNQEPILFATSIKENILFGKEKATTELVMDAAKAANAHDFIINLPDGYDTHVGQYGFQLSGGQKQRIAIARALLRDPKILLLDEAASALDAESERTVQEALDKASLGRTTIIVAHRLATIRKADKIVVLQSGNVIESGTHDDLIQMKNGGAYHTMVQMQQSTVQNDVRSSGRATPTGVQTPRARRSWQNSPVFSTSMANSPQMYSYYESDEDNIAAKSHYPPPSNWRLVKMNAPEWKRAVLGCSGAATFGAMLAFHAYCLGALLDVFFLKDKNKLKSETRTYCILFLSFGVICFFTNLFQHQSFAIMGENLTKRVREKMLQNMLTFEIGWFDRDENTSAAISARLATEANMVRSLVGDRLSLLVQVFFSACIAYTIALVVTWRVSLVMISMQPLIIGSIFSKTELMKSTSKKVREAQNEGSQLASEAVINNRTITAFSSQKRILSLFKETMRGSKKESIKQSWVSGVGLFSSQFLITATIALTYWYGGRLMIKGKISPKHLFEAFFILMSTGKNIADAGSMTSDLAEGGNAIRQVFAILDRKTEIQPDDHLKTEVEKPLKGFIELKHVSFAYPSRPSQTIFHDLSMKIEAGKMVALVGQSGSGKSTVIGLIERFYDPLKGMVMIDGCDVKSYNLRSLRAHIALVSQEPTLFGGTIRENIMYGKEGATEGELRKAAVLANAHDFISSMKDGYDTYCGERGVQLSGGQKQRIALARAILKNPSILLLDEATSALDSVSENLIQESLEKMMVGRTSVVVAHRLSTIKKSDSIAVLKDGKVVEQGSHSELLAVGTRGSYYSLIKLQNGQSPIR